MPKNLQNIFTRLRCTLLEIRVNTGRWREGMAYRDRICQFCNKGEIEDECHFLSRWPTWSGFRGDLKHYEFATLMAGKNRALTVGVYQFVSRALVFRNELLNLDNSILIRRNMYRARLTA